MTDWLALVIGNTRWHWAWFADSDLKHVWHHPHLSEAPLQSFWSHQTRLSPSQLAEIDIWAVSVVPSQAQYLEDLASVHWITNFPLKGVYATMGLDRAATLWGAGETYGWPTLVIDGGTALTFTAGAEQTFVGGAILLGLRSHLAALHSYTAALPTIEPPDYLPSRWATDTSSSIQSGVVHTILDSIHHFIQSWRQQYFETTTLFTGGDGQYLYQLYQQKYLTKQNQALQNSTWFEPNLMFYGIAAYRREATRAL